MIRRLRSRHRTLALMAAVAAPTVFALALMDRKAVPLDGTPLTAMQGEASSAIDEIARRQVTVGDALLSVALHESPAGQYMTFAPTGRGQTGPDVLVYWQSDTGSALTPGAALLGPLPSGASRRVDLPASAPDGNVVFYSLAHQQVLATLRVEDML